MERCWICGGAGTKKSILYEPDRYGGYDQAGKRCFCDKCFDEFYAEHTADRKEYTRLKKKLMYERAIRILEKQDVDIYEYKEALDAVQEFYRDNLNRFDSSHEMVAAAILIHNEVVTKTQFKVGNYRVDFYLPELKIVLEVDGESHKYKKKLDNERDIAIRKELGLDHEIIRVPTESVEQNAELLVEAIKSIKEERQKLRKKNFGQLPSWYK